jgi:ABC-type dipeptide/oligopeptide/nickel transport system permease component
VTFGVMTITFFVGRVFSGDPTNLYSPPQADAALRAKVRASLGLDKSLIDQYFTLWVPETRSMACDLQVLANGRRSPDRNVRLIDRVAA